MSTDVEQSEALGEQGVAVVTLLARMTSAGISEDRARGHITRGVVRVAGEPVADPELALPWPVRWVIGPE